MKRMVTLFLGLALASPALAQRTPAPSNFSGLFVPWSGTSRDSLRAEADARRPIAGAIPVIAGQGRSRDQAVALGERVAEAVRRGDCAEGERIARAAGDFPLVRAVRDYCRSSL